MSVIVQPLTPLSKVDTMPLVSNWLIFWANLASAVGETKLAFAVIVNEVGAEDGTPMLLVESLGEI